MNLLLDTHILLWWLGGDDRLMKGAVELIENPGNDVWISAASAWEISIKRGLGKLRMEGDVSQMLAGEGFGFLPIRFPEIDRVEALPSLHRDPFDRMLICQALQYGYTLMTADEKVLGYQAPVMDCRSTGT